MTVDIAGTDWPLFKLEALALGFLVFATVLMLAGALGPAVLAGAAVTVAAWWGLRACEEPSDQEPKGRTPGAR